MSLERYSVIDKRNPREIVLLKSTPCKWGRCSFCDYIHDNSTDTDGIIKLNKEVLSKVTGQYKKLEIINSGSCFELPTETLKDIKEVVESKAIETIYFESHFMYKNRLEEFRNFFDAQIIFKTGIETFDESFRNDVLKKGVHFNDLNNVSDNFDSVCLMVGVKGQTKEMIENDIKIGLEHFEHICINVYVNNTTEIVSDQELIKWFKETYSHLESNSKVDVLWHNEDYGVGGKNE